MIYALVIPEHLKFKVDHLPSKRDIPGSYATTRAFIGVARKEINRQWLIPPNIFALSRVCRFIYHESTQLMYSRNTFACHTEPALKQWHKDRLPAHAKAVRKLHIDHHLPEKFKFRLTEMFENLEKLDFTICHQVLPGKHDPGFRLYRTEEWQEALSKEIREEEGKELEIKFVSHTDERDGTSLELLARFGYYA